jgi:hypothetical protein
MPRLHGFSYDVLQAYDVPSSDPGALDPGYNPAKHRAEGWMAQMYHVDQRVLCGGRIVSSGHVEALRSLGVTHVVSCDDEGDFDRRFWLDAGTRLWVPLTRQDEDWQEERMITLGRWIEPVLSRTSSKLYVHGHLGFSRGAALGYFTLRLGGMGRGIARSRVLRGRVDSEDELGRLHAGFTRGWYPQPLPRHLEQIDRLMGRWISLLDYGVRPLASN